MTKDFFASVNPSTFTNLFTSANPFASGLMVLSMSAGSGSIAPLSFTGSGLMACLPSSHPLLLVILDMTKFFYIRKPVTSADNTTVMKILKGIIQIARIPFSTFNKAWQYMLGILDLVH